MYATLRTMPGACTVSMVGQYMGQSIKAEWDMESHCLADLEDT